MPYRYPTAWADSTQGQPGPPAAPRRECGSPGGGARVCYVGDNRCACPPCRPARSHTMNQFLLPAAASIIIGLLLGAAAALGVTLQVGTHTPVPHSDNSASMLNRVEYGDRK